MGGREVRRVPPGWEHPRKPNGKYRPLHDGFNEARRRWDANHDLWLHGKHPDQDKIGATEQDYDKWNGGGRPNGNDYMPDWPEEERTHYQLYETCTEGTPRSPVFANLDELYEYAAEHVTTFADHKATKEEWKQMLEAGFVYAVETDKYGNRMVFS